MTNFLNVVNPSLIQRVWHIVNNVNELQHCTENNLLRFDTYFRGYYKYCNIKKCKCRENIKLVRAKTNLELYGVENTFQSLEKQEKIKQTNLEKYGVENVFQSPIKKEKIKQTNLEKYGVENVFQSPIKKEKIKQTNLERYGVEYSSQSSIVKEKTKKTNLEKYGVSNTFQISNVKDKIKKTNIEKYGVEFPFQNKNVITKIKQTNLKKYGVEFPFQSDRFQNALNNIKLEKYGTQHPSQRHIIDLFPLINTNDFWKQFNSYQEIKDYFGDKISSTTILRYIHKYRPDLSLYSSISKSHKIINEFLDSLNIEYINNIRSVIQPVELDIFVPSKNLAIEINGVYWHTENKGKDKNYHLNKTLRCKEKGINLIHLTDIDILNKTDIVFNLLKDRLNLNKEIDIKYCSVIDLDRETVIKFIKENSLFEYKESDIHKGVLYNNEIVSVISINEINNEFEITNCTTKIGYNIKNLLVELIHDINGVFNISVNLQIGNGSICNSWKLIHITQPNYIYTKNYIEFYNSLDISKDNLRNILDVYDSDLDEYENIINNGYHVTWDCGNEIYTYNNKDNII